MILVLPFGVDTGRFLSEIGIDKKSITDPGGRTSFEDVIKLWDESSKLTNNRLFGIDTSYFGSVLNSCG